MNMEKRITLIQLLSEELCKTATEYAKIKKENKYPVYGCNTTRDNCHTVLKRRIVTLRAELLELSNSL